MSFTNGDVRCKKSEPEQKTASKSVDADRRGSRASVKKINQAKIPKGGSFFGGAQLGMTRVLSEAKRISFHTVNIEYN